MISSFVFLMPIPTALRSARPCRETRSRSTTVHSRSSWISATSFLARSRYLAVSVRPAGGGAFTPLTPRQAISATPYSIRSRNAVNADNATFAATAGNITGIVAVANGGTGSSTQAFVDLSTDQAGIGGNKTFTGNRTVNGSLGIGASPTMKLTVGGSALVYPQSGNGQLFFRNRTNGNFSQVIFNDDANTYRGYLGYIGANAGLG